jgi:hypothetical protein
MLSLLYPFLAITAVADEPAAATASGHVFGWPFLSWEEMKPRGGTTTGSEVTLRVEPKEAWTKLQEEGIDKVERDRRAIRAMAGSYRVSFDFIETFGFTESYKPPRPYFSWATEHVEVIEDREDFISLQHSLVMYFKNPDGEDSGPHVMKHWRQDWTWQDPEIFTYRGFGTWEREKSQSPSGKWSQAVFQVDDSPRYEVMGEWSHEGGMSVWKSDNAPRPLPRRESSARDDYNILEGVHEITLTPNGWVHVQNNRKLDRAANGGLTYRGGEIGVNRYEEISEPELSTAWREYWTKTGNYWKEVRDAWAEIHASRDRFTVRGEVDGRRLFQVHFERAAEIAEADESDAAGDAAHARETVNAFVVEEEPASANSEGSDPS